MTLSADGSELLLGSDGVLVDTSTGATQQLAARGGWWSGDPAPVLYDGLYKATMDASATRFLYLAADARGIQQLATLEIDPGGLGEAPAIADAAVNPPSLLLDGASAATVSARVSTSQTLLRVGDVFLSNGLTDVNVGGDVLLDEGTQGDATARDGIFTNSGARANCCAVVGPHTVRIKAELRAADGRRHATAVEIGPVEVRKQ
jgi:hypothetical protein